MRKIIISGIAALIAATSFATTADAGPKWRHHGWHHGHHHHGWRHGHRHGRWGWGGGVWIGGPAIVIGSGCVVRKHVNRNGVVVKRRYC
jgi:hypothetical protein